MEITQRFVVQHPVEVVWESLADVQLVAECMPGAELTESIGDDRYRGKIKVKLGPIAAAFAGEVAVTRNQADWSGTVEGKGNDKLSGSRVQSKMRYSLKPESDGRETAVEIKADVALSGSLAQFSRSSIMNDISAMLTAEFATCLQRKLGATSREEAAAVKAEAVQSGKILTILVNRVGRAIAAFLRRLFDRQSRV